MSGQPPHAHLEVDPLPLAEPAAGPPPLVLGELEPLPPPTPSPGPWRGLAGASGLSLALHALVLALGLLLASQVQRAVVAAQEQPQVVMVNLLPGAAPGQPGPAAPAGGQAAPAPTVPAPAPLVPASQAKPTPLSRPQSVALKPAPHHHPAPLSEAPPPPPLAPAAPVAQAAPAPASPTPDPQAVQGPAAGEGSGSGGTGQAAVGGTGPGSGGAGGRGGGPDVPPRLLEQTRPAYPSQARQLGLEGAVKVRVLISRQGRVARVDILSADHPGMFEEAVRQALAHWRFQPAQKAGQPVEVVSDLTVRFRLDD